jgi:hypothetical protein
MTDISSKVYSLFHKAVLIGAATAFVGLILPGLVAQHDRVFNREKMIDKVEPKLPSEMRKQIDDYQTLKNNADQALVDIDKKFVDPKKPPTTEEIATLTAQRAVAERLADAKPPVTFMPFYLSPAMLLWVLSLTPLAWLAFLMYPGRNALGSLNPVAVVAGGMLAYVSYQWTVWMRYFVLKNQGRKVIGLANYDASPAEFWLQEINTILFWLLLSVVCFQWLHYAQSWRTKVIQEDISLTDVTNQLSISFLRWQLASLLLALTFFPFTHFYWDLIVHSNDERFLLAAIILHTMWASVWAIISVPLFQAWWQWRGYKARALEQAMHKANSDSVVKILEAAEPIADWAKIVSATLALLSFVSPIVKVFL